MFLTYRNQSIELDYKSVDWFLYWWNIDLNGLIFFNYQSKKLDLKAIILDYFSACYFSLKNERRESQIKHSIIRRCNGKE